MLRLSFLIACLLLESVGQLPSTKEWRGLSPIISTRADVERVLGPPSRNDDNQLLTYDFPDVVVFIGFSANWKCEQKLPYTSWNVTADTVTGIRVNLKRQVLISESGIDLTKLKKIKGDYDVAGHFYYSNTEDGFSVNAGSEYIKGYIYEPASKHSSLRCPANKQIR